jgi:hypothetical protein
VKQTTMKTRNWFLFRPNWNVEDDLFEFWLFCFLPWLFLAFFHFKVETYGKGLIWRWNTLIYH